VAASNRQWAIQQPLEKRSSAALVVATAFRTKPRWIASRSADPKGCVPRPAPAPGGVGSWRPPSRSITPGRTGVAEWPPRASFRVSSDQAEDVCAWRVAGPAPAGNRAAEMKERQRMPTEHDLGPGSAGRRSFTAVRRIVHGTGSITTFSLQARRVANRNRCRRCGGGDRPSISVERAPLAEPLEASGIRVT